MVPQTNMAQFVSGVSGQAPQAQAFDQNTGGHPQIVNQSNHGYLPPSSQFSQPPATMVGSAEYSAAMELEMWKLTEEEAFQEQLKAREKTHMAKLGRECDIARDFHHAVMIVNRTHDQAG